MLPRTGPDAPWPASLWVVRHGESAGNVARDAAEAEGLERLDLSHRDVDVPLSDLGRRQAAALGRWTAQQPADERPTVVWSSPYVRARQSAEIALETAGLDLPVVVPAAGEHLVDLALSAPDGTYLARGTLDPAGDVNVVVHATLPAGDVRGNVGVAG